MVRMLPAVAAQGTRAADHLGNKLVTAAMWLLGCLVAAGAAFLASRRESCSPSSYADAFPHSLLGGWTPCAASLLLTGVPWIMVTVYTFRQRLQQRKRRLSGERPPSSVGPTAADAYYFCPLMLAWVALLALRVFTSQDDPCSKSWQFLDNFFVIIIIQNVLSLSFLDRGTNAQGQKATCHQPFGCKTPSAVTVLVATILLADVIKHMLISRFPWQPVTGANKCLPLLGGWNAIAFILEVYLLMGATLYYWVPLPAAAADDGCAALKEPLLDDDGSADITGNAAASHEAAKDSSAGADASSAEP